MIRPRGIDCGPHTAGANLVRGRRDFGRRTGKPECEGKPVEDQKGEGRRRVRGLLAVKKKNPDTGDQGTGRTVK